MDKINYTQQNKHKFSLNRVIVLTIILAAAFLYYLSHAAHGYAQKEEFGDGILILMWLFYFTVATVEFSLPLFVSMIFFAVIVENMYAENQIKSFILFILIGGFSGVGVDVMAMLLIGMLPKMPTLAMVFLSLLILHTVVVLIVYWSKRKEFDSNAENLKL
ncbi:hypothetical protein [Sulfurovum sp.]|uniref:hypothetical protein n=1 Tax=Sulfurovum sp. TaxID=1969726 RepID=UPI0025F3F27D|nr:hypothetical protein [Sulfurovum sp.]